MSASFPKINIDAQAHEADGGAMPPFWELEILIAQGYGLEQALVVMARRRDDPLRSSGERLHQMASNQRYAGAWRHRRVLPA